MTSTAFFGGQFFAGGFFDGAAPTSAPTPTTIGGIGEYHILLPREPKKPEPYRARRNMENQDRADIAAIVDGLIKAGLV